MLIFFLLFIQRNRWLTGRRKESHNLQMEMRSFLFIVNRFHGIIVTQIKGIGLVGSKARLLYFNHSPYLAVYFSIKCTDFLAVSYLTAIQKLHAQCILPSHAQPKTDITGLAE